MRIVDVDAHLHEPLDWLERTDSSVARELGPPVRLVEAFGLTFGTGGFRGLPDAQQPGDGWDVLPPGFLEHVQITDDRQPKDHGDRSDAFFGAEARLRWCDERGIDVQLLNPTFLFGTVATALKARRLDLLPAIRQAWNRWALDDVDGHTDRLIPVTQIDLRDLDGSIAEMTRMREAGSRAFAIPEAPVQLPGDELATSITHPRFEPLWSAAEDLGMAVLAHVGFSRESVNRGWANNGCDSLRTFGLLSMLVSQQLGPQMLLGSMALDGVFERHPRLVVVVEEMGIDWLPHLVSKLELCIGRTPEVLHDGEYRPPNLTQGETYRLPLTPVEYLQRQVRAASLPVWEPIRKVMEQVPPELVCFCSDYPHVEGTADAVAICERQLTGFGDDVRAEFFGGVGQLLGV